MKRWAALLLLAGCVDYDDCPFVNYIDAFQIVLSSEAWSSGQYSVEVTYSDKAGAAAFRCDVPVPALPSLDAGIAPDAGIDARGRFACTSLMPTWRISNGQAGQELVLYFEGTPTTAHVVVREGTRLVSEQDVALGYGIERPYGDDCPGPLRAATRVELPQ